MWEYSLQPFRTFGDPSVERDPMSADPGADRVMFDGCGRICVVMAHRGDLGEHSGIASMGEYLSDVDVYWGSDQDSLAPS